VTQQQGPRQVHVLVVDDDADSREVTAAFLRGSGFVVDEFESAEDAHAHAATADAVVTDITLPGMSGYELASRLRAEAATQNLVIFALSGRSDASPEQARLFDRVIVKPFDPDALVRALQAATGAAS
jgi:CheY-like chemotaxis protein